ARLAKRRSGRAAACARIPPEPARSITRSRARADAGGPDRDIGVQHGLALAPAATFHTTPPPGRSALGRAHDRPLAAARLAARPRLRDQRRQGPLLFAAVQAAPLARPLRLHGEGGRPLVAGGGRYLRDPRREARARHAGRHARLARGARAAPLARPGVPALAQKPSWRVTMSWRSTTTAPAPATPAPAAGARALPPQAPRRKTTPRQA